MESTNADASSAKSRHLPWVVLGIAAVAIVADRLTKMWAINSLVEGEDNPILGQFLSFQLIHNPGAAFSMGEGSTWIFTVLSVIVIGAIIWYTAAGKIHSLVLALLIGLVGGGAIGNLIDRLIQPPGFGRGHVIDFINYNDWFVGNVADIWIVGGAIALMLYFLIADSRSSKNPAEELGEDSNE